MEAAGRAYYEFRAALMVRNNQGLTATYNRFHDPNENDPDIVKLRRLHAEMDQVLLKAYEWDDLAREGRCECDFYPDYYEEPEQPGGDPVPCSIRYRWPDATRDEVLARLLKLNAERAEEEGKAESATKNATVAHKPKAPSKRRRKTQDQISEPTLL